MGSESVGGSGTEKKREKSRLQIDTGIPE